MVQARLTLSIGFVGGKHEEVIDIPDEEYNDCETDMDRQRLLDMYWNDWSSNYIDGVAEFID
jgi:hypothetical protein